VAVPYHRGFALIGDADGNDVPRRQVRLGQGRRNHFIGIAQYLLRRMFDPAGLRIDLRMLLLRRGDDTARRVEHDEARARGALIDGSNVGIHRRQLLTLRNSPAASDPRILTSNGRTIHMPGTGRMKERARPYLALRSVICSNSAAGTGLAK
jgi:hypothetical protein